MVTPRRRHTLPTQHRQLPMGHFPLLAIAGANSLVPYHVVKSPQFIWGLSTSRWITYPFPNFNGAAVEVWEWIRNLFMGAWSSNEFLRLAFKIGCQDSNSSDGHQGVMPYCSSTIFNTFEYHYNMVVFPPKCSKWTFHTKANHGMSLCSKSGLFLYLSPSSVTPYYLSHVIMEHNCVVHS